jgi:hypothetical protein
VNDGVIARTSDPDGRGVVFDGSSRSHLSARRPDLLQYVDVILTAVSLPDHRTLDPEAGRERFYRQSILDRRRWLRVVVDFTEIPGRIVTVLVQTSDPRKAR